MARELPRALRERLRRLMPPSEGIFGLYVNDLRTGRSLALRADESFPSASVIKLPIMLALLEMVQRGAVSLDDIVTVTAWDRTGGSGIFQHLHEGLQVTVGDACMAMIALSDNTATNAVLDVTGIEAVNAFLDAQGCHRTRLHRYFGKPDMPGPTGPSQAVPAEIGRLLERLALAQMLTPALCRRALLYLRRQQHRALAPRLLPEGTITAHKTGSLDGVRHDAGLMWLPGGGKPAGEPAPAAPRNLLALPEDDLPDSPPVVFVALSKGVPDLRWTVENRAEILVARAARAVYDALSEHKS